jgi:uncharacterized protein with von Willebrand factor type A (vWA) domain
MFIDFFYLLRKMKVPVSLHEWMALNEALEKGLARESLSSFYYIARSLLVKKITDYDRFDQAFLSYFRGLDAPEDIIEEILEGLNRDIEHLNLTPEERARLEALDLDEVRANFEKQFREGHYKNHVGGNKAIGTGGTSTQGAFGYNPAGVRIGQGESRHRRAIQIAEKRVFRNYSSDVQLDVRNIRVALSRLRSLIPEGPEDELNIDKTIDETAKNAGELELIWEKSLLNGAKVLLLMDAGGSMMPFVKLVSRLFSASKTQLNRLKYYYFHNCIYQHLYKDIARMEAIPTMEVLRSLTPDYKVIFVGDALMAPSELTRQGGAIDYYYNNDTPGIIWLTRFAETFKKSIWLNPEDKLYWEDYTIDLIRKVFPMYPLTLDGLEEGIRHLVR